MADIKEEKKYLYVCMYMCYLCVCVRAHTLPKQAGRYG